MKLIRSIVLGALLAFSIGAMAFAGEPKSEPATIGTAEMKSDRTIILHLRAPLPGGGTGEGTLVYPPTDPEYKKILDHVAPIAPGQTVLVRPWPEPK